MGRNIEKGPNFVDPPEKAEEMAYAEEEQRQKEARREKAGLPVDPEKRDEVAEEAGEKWEEKEAEQEESSANEIMEQNIDSIEEFLKNDSFDMYLDKAFYEDPKAFEKLKSYLGAGEPQGEQGNLYKTDIPSVHIQVYPNEGRVMLFKVR